MAVLGKLKANGSSDHQSKGLMLTDYQKGKNICRASRFL